ncbi:uncharacterized protein LOC105689738 [Athalia rosae]|uniref:uncharacterized protein LOC105689738 n=1 Tax=Athalia rosae TaxID=37344 RepID=UPI002033712E|nr:uncharacterized protein LOC105689738 [Athalia rosae]XP_048513898.1 uncharacterized protein LOC105689738 [Athalia rosae]
MTRERLDCRDDVQRENILTIVPSVLRWEGKCDVDKILEYDPSINRRLYICYSMHASYAELKAFIDYFKPVKIVPCVCPDKSKNEIYKLLHELTNYEKMMTGDVGCCSSKLELPIKRTFKQSFSSKYFNDDDDDL